MSKLKKTTGKKSKTKKGIPAWAVAPFRSNAEDVEGLYHLVRLAARGISMVRATPMNCKVFGED